MSTQSSIEWTDTTWNPLAGCTWASAGCDHCYAAVMARRLGCMAEADLAAGRDPGQKQKYIGITHKNKAGRIMFNGQVNLDPAAIDEPLRWKKPRRVFVNSMSDLFHKNVPDAFIGRVWAMMLATPQHTYQVLTKRPERMADVVTRLVEEGQRKGLRAPDNIWLGTSVENQAAADARIPHLLKVPARVRFLSCEPLLGAVNLRSIPIDTTTRADVVAGAYIYTGALSGSKHTNAARIQWVIAGGESGHGARPMHPDWARGLRDQCQAAGVAYFFKQWGEYRPTQEADWENENIRPKDIGLWNLGPDWRASMVRVGKHAAGRLLDGREWNEVPA